VDELKADRTHGFRKLPNKLSHDRILSLTVVTKERKKMYGSRSVIHDIIPFITRAILISLAVTWRLLSMV
jgi:hypothetical protein